MFKNQLQELAQRSCFNLPAYTCMREGPDHALRFKATVTFNGEVFESPNFCGTLRQAEQAAAEVALNILSKRGPSHSLAGRLLDETGVCKNLLQETSQRAGVPLPVYTTTRSGPGHMPLFSCAVEVAGMAFTGDAAKTKKQAEKNAAMAAWSTLKQLAKQDDAPWAPPSEFEVVEDQEPNIVARAMMRIHGKDDCMNMESLSQQSIPLLQWPAQGRTQEPVGTPLPTKLIADGGVKSAQQLLGTTTYYNCTGSSHDLSQSQWSMFSRHRPGEADPEKVICGGKAGTADGSKWSQEFLAAGSHSGKVSLSEIPNSSKTMCREGAEVLNPLYVDYKLDELEWLAGETFKADASTIKRSAHESNGVAAATTTTIQPLENPMVWCRSSTHRWNGKRPESSAMVSGGNFYAGNFVAPPVRVRSVVAVCAAPTRPIVEEIEDTDENVYNQTRQMLDGLSL
ncbi:hypothetical protein O6H91_04G130800 [Diphasiastrum complanatum]|uniref:Uncharacterized protein n=1 Tax=Diphasiastrum complanatum TaxID=34168 RepID=A0ACC2E1W0_DIPCM|nr:hypothetical protein O6H91_04G130800 [Diphasiastrum complanatum]